MKKHSLRTPMVLLALAALMAVAVIPAAGRPPESGPVEVEGEFVYFPDLIALETMRKHEFILDTERQWWTGGIATAPYPGDPEAAAPVNGPASVVFTRNGRGFYIATMDFDKVVIDGKSGEITMRLWGVYPPKAATWHGKWRILSGTDELEGLKGKGTFTGLGWNPEDPTVPGPIDYEGSIGFMAEGPHNAR